MRSSDLSTVAHREQSLCIVRVLEWRAHRTTGWKFMTRTMSKGQPARHAMSQRSAQGKLPARESATKTPLAAQGCTMYLCYQQECLFIFSFHDFVL